MTRALTQACAKHRRCPPHAGAAGATEGFTLIESVIAAAIIAIVALVMVSAFVALNATNQRSVQLGKADDRNEQSIATGQAPEQRIEGQSIDFPGGSIPGRIDVYVDDSGSSLRVFNFVAEEA
jgi:prepilin-type N-terminal cleavage/methylation domain-containing protein